jgi:hypothetical protein
MALVSPVIFQKDQLAARPGTRDKKLSLNFEHTRVSFLK